MSNAVVGVANFFLLCFIGFSTIHGFASNIQHKICYDAVRLWHQSLKLSDKHKETIHKNWMEAIYHTVYLEAQERRNPIFREPTHEQVNAAAKGRVLPWFMLRHHYSLATYAGIMSFDTQTIQKVSATILDCARQDKWAELYYYLQHRPMMSVLFKMQPLFLSNLLECINWQDSWNQRIKDSISGLVFQALNEHIEEDHEFAAFDTIDYLHKEIVPTREDRTECFMALMQQIDALKGSERLNYETLNKCALDAFIGIMLVPTISSRYQEYFLDRACYGNVAQLNYIVCQEELLVQLFQQQEDFGFEFVQQLIVHKSLDRAVLYNMLALLVNRLPAESQLADFLAAELVKSDDCSMTARLKLLLIDHDRMNAYRPAEFVMMQAQCENDLCECLSYGCSQSSLYNRCEGYKE